MSRQLAFSSTISAMVMAAFALSTAVKAREPVSVPMSPMIAATAASDR